jgi:hypothetical protein
MKNKILAILLIFMLAVSIFYGCGLIQQNSERNLNQVIAIVGDENYKDEILKKDLVSIYLSQGSQYIQNYGMTVNDTINMIYQQLINNRLIIQEGARMLIEKNGLDKDLEYYLSKNYG